MSFRVKACVRVRVRSCARTSVRDRSRIVVGLVQGQHWIRDRIALGLGLGFVVEFDLWAVIGQVLELGPRLGSELWYG